MKYCASVAQKQYTFPIQLHLVHVSELSLSMIHELLRGGKCYDEDQFSIYKEC